MLLGFPGPATVFFSDGTQYAALQTSEAIHCRCLCRSGRFCLSSRHIVLGSLAVDPTNTLGIPPLKGAPHVPPIWIYPPTEAADSIIVNPVYPPDYKDFILVFPADSGVPPLYIVLSVPGHKYHPTPQGGLPAFPDATRVRSKTSVQGGGGLRPRWTDLSGFIYGWDRQHGTVEKYNKRGKHLGEFDPNTGEQKKPAKSGRTTPK